MPSGSHCIWPPSDNGLPAASGRKTENTVPLEPAVVRLRTRMDPWCFCTMPWESQRPRPVPASPLVE
jgi:hypothetical protein